MYYLYYCLPSVLFVKRYKDREKKIGLPKKEAVAAAYFL